MKIHFSIAKNKKSQSVSDELLKLYGQVEISNAEVIVAVGGDGAMLAAMRQSIDFNIPVFGLNRGNIGFLKNEFEIGNFGIRIALNKFHFEKRNEYLYFKKFINSIKGTIR